MLSALSNLRVIELARVLAGPWAAQTLADLGADVVKVEHPARGDDTRAWGPPYLKPPGEQGNHGESAYYLCTNRNKRSIAIDFATREGSELVCDLVKTADIVIENFRPGALAKYGLDHESLMRDNPRLIYCSITAFGQSGPYHHRPGYDFAIQGIGGLMSLTGVADGEPGGGPMKVGVAVTDLAAGLYGAIGILAAVNARHLTGRGQHLDLSLFDTQVAMLANQASNFLVSGVVPQRMGNSHPNVVPYQAFVTSDGHLIVAVGSDEQFRRLCEEIGRPELGRDDRFATNRGRVENRAVLVPELAAALRSRSHRDLARALGSGWDSRSADQHHRPGLRRAAGRRAGHSRRAPASLRVGAFGGEPGPALRHAAALSSRPALAWRAYGRDPPRRAQARHRPHRRAASGTGGALR